MKRSKKAIILIAALILVGATTTGCRKSKVSNNVIIDTNLPEKLKPNENLSFTILHVNDTHGRVKPGTFDGMGYSRLHTLAEIERSQNSNVILLDAGDTIHGTVFAGLSRGQAVVDIMNEMNYVAMAPGNHDFNYGLDRLEELRETMNFSLIATNVDYKENGEGAFDPYIIKELPNGAKIGIFGLATPETAYKTNPNNVEAITFGNPTIAARKAVNELKAKGVHYIIALSHLGIDEDSYYTSYRVATEVEGIDMIVDGHSHSTLESGEKVGDTLIVQAGYYDKNLGRVEVTIDTNGIRVANASLITKDYAMENVDEDEGINSIISSIDAENETITSVVVGESDIYLNGAREFVRTGETNLGNMITESVLAKTEADIVMTNGGGIRSSISEGTITRGDIVSVLPFGNYAVVIDVSGQDIKDALENGVQSYPSERGSFPHVAGIRFEFDPSREEGDRVTKVTLANGQELNVNSRYNLATNDFMAAGGDGYEMFKGRSVVAEYESLEEILSEYIENEGITHKTVDGRVKVLD